MDPTSCETGQRGPPISVSTLPPSNTKEALLVGKGTGWWWEGRMGNANAVSWPGEQGEGRPGPRGCFLLCRRFTNAPFPP